MAVDYLPRRKGFGALLPAVAVLALVVLQVACVTAPATVAPPTSLPTTAVPATSAASATAQVPTLPSATQPPPPGPVPPNASRVTATVRKYTVWPPGSLKNTNPPVPENQTLYSYSLEILTSEAKDSSKRNLAVPGGTYETFSTTPLAPDAVGKKIEATLELTGGTDGVRWYMTEVRAIQ